VKECFPLERTEKSSNRKVAPKNETARAGGREDKNCDQCQDFPKWWAGGELFSIEIKRQYHGGRACHNGRIGRGWQPSGQPGGLDSRPPRPLQQLWTRRFRQLARSIPIDLLERIGQLHAFLSGNATLADAAHLWVEAELVAGEIERNPPVSKEEAKAAQDLRDGVSSFIAQMRNHEASPDSSAACASLDFLKSAIEHRTLGEHDRS
jgi:hypothetical protein